MENTTTIQQGPSAIVAIQSSPIVDQNTHVRHQSLAVIAGNSISLSSVSATFYWSYYPLGSRTSQLVYNGEISTDFQKKAKIDVRNCDARNCTFYVDELDDAGTFTCMQIADQYWSLTVLGEYTV